MRQSMIAAVVAALISTTAVAGNAIIENEYVRAGVNETTGTFGSGGSTRPGLQYDSTGTSTFPADSAQGDYLTPGSPFDGFAVKVDGTNYSNNNSGSSAIAGAWVGTPSAASAVWKGGITGVFDITNTYSLPSAQQYIDITSAITARQAMTTLSFGRFIDPDAMPMPGDTSATDNVLGYGTIPTTNVVFSEATVSRYALGLYSTDSNVAAGIQGWSQEADAYTGTIYYQPDLDSSGNYQWVDPSCTNIAWGCSYLKKLDSSGNPIPANYGTGDDTIGLSWTWTGVSIGDILTANYAYIFGPSAFAAASTAISGGAGGGANITTGTLVDIGSATDSAAGGGTATPAPVITTATIVDTTRPVLTAGIRHHTATETATAQTIAREQTTTTTTPMRTVTYTDGVETSSVVAISTIASAITDPGSFVGRIDQVDKAITLQDMAIRGLAFDGVQVVNNFGDGSTSGVSFGGQQDIEDGVFVGGGIAILNTRASNEDGNARASTNVFNLRVGQALEEATTTLSLQHAVSDYSANRTIGDFTNSNATSGTNTSVEIKVVGTNKNVRPVVGITTGKRTVNGFTEAGDIQSARTVGKATDSYAFATLGAQATLAEGITAEALHYTDGINSVRLAVAKEWEKDKTFVISAQRNFSDHGTTTALTAGVQIKF